MIFQHGKNFHVHHLILPHGGVLRLHVYVQKHFEIVSPLKIHLVHGPGNLTETSRAWNQIFRRPWPKTQKFMNEIGDGIEIPEKRF